jgi:hypothetical protein
VKDNYGENRANHYLDAKGSKILFCSMAAERKTLLGAAANLLAWTARKLSVKTSLSRLINN